MGVGGPKGLNPHSAEPGSGMVYSPEPMQERDQTPEVRELEQKVDELERLADSLGDVPDEELVGSLDVAVKLLADINAGIEARLEAAGSESREIGGLLADVDFGPFDEALADLERRERSQGEPGV